MQHRLQGTSPTISDPATPTFNSAASFFDLLEQDVDRGDV
jgi:hypothetical protein